MRRNNYLQIPPEELERLLVKQWIDLNEVDDSTIDPYKDTPKIELEDVNMDDEMIPTNDYSSMEPFEIYNHDQSGGIRNNIIIGKRILKKRLGIIGSRMLK